ncbi:CopG family transcriptional regulator [Candidatus Woesearchaeota archaeon]|nr:CopG family transcriptional regulator [Candidatus Woesearchaeota archaeon]
MSKKIQVSFSDAQIDLISKFKGEFGVSESEIVRGIVIAWLSEKSFISTVVKNRICSSMDNKQNTEESNEK